jgi:hypothetical protein
MVEIIKYNELKLAIIIRANFKNTGIEFFTEEFDSQQLGFMTRQKGHIIIPHRHNLIERKVHLTQEVLFIKSGLIRCDFYDNNEVYVESKVLEAGDVVLLCDGGHGFEILETAEIIEVKQGPYCGVEDKVRFNPIKK